MQKVIRENVARGAAVMTDEAGSFVGLSRAYRHDRVNHSAGEYVRDNVHTNSIESVWALLKRQIIGVHQWVSPKHLSRYGNEMARRYNRRDLGVTDRMNAIFGCVEGPLKYKTLIA